MNAIINTIEKHGMPQKWQLFFLVLSLLTLSQFFIPDSFSKGILTSAIGVGILIGIVGGFFHNKHSLHPWVFLLIGATVFGASNSLTFMNADGFSINTTFIALLIGVGMVSVTFFSFNIALIYEKMLNLPGFTVNLILFSLSIISFAIFVYPDSISELINNTNLIQKVFFNQYITVSHYVTSGNYDQYALQRKTFSITLSHSPCCIIIWALYCAN